MAPTVSIANIITLGLLHLTGGVICEHVLDGTEVSRHGAQIRSGDG